MPNKPTNTAVRALGLVTFDRPTNPNLITTELSFDPKIFQLAIGPNEDTACYQFIVDNPINLPIRRGYYPPSAVLPPYSAVYLYNFTGFVRFRYYIFVRNKEMMMKSLRINHFSTSLLIGK